MKALSLWQPWATLLAGGAKRCETRGWATRHRGPLLVHAAKHWTRELFTLCGTDPFRAALARLGYPPDVPEKRRGTFAPRGLPFGVIVGRVDVVACVPSEDVGAMDIEGDPCYWPGHPTYFPLQLSPTERAFGDYSPGRFAFLCENAVLFKTPIPYRGEQGLFNVPDDLVKEAA